MILTDLQDHFSFFSLKISVTYLFSFRLSPGNLTKDDTVDDLDFRYYKRFHFLHISIYNV